MTPFSPTPSYIPTPAIGVKSSNTTNVGGIVGGIIAAILIVASIISIVIFLWFRKYKAQKTKDSIETTDYQNMPNKKYEILIDIYTFLIQ